MNVINATQAKTCMEFFIRKFIETKACTRKFKKGPTSEDADSKREINLINILINAHIYIYL